MGLPAGKITPQGGEPQPNTVTPDNVISWEQAMQYFDEKFNTLSTKIEALEKRTEKQMAQSEQRSKDYVDAQIEQAQRENTTSISSLETLIQEVVQNVRSQLAEMRDIVGGARKDAAYMRNAASDLQAGQRQHSDQIDALQERDIQHVKKLAILENNHAVLERHVNDVATLAHQNTAAQKKFEEGFAPMNEFFRRQLETQNNRRRVRARVRSYLLGTRQGNTIVGAVVGSVVSFVAEHTGIDTEAMRRWFFQFIESIF